MNSYLWQRKTFLFMNSFLPKNISDFSLLFYLKTATPSGKSHPLFVKGGAHYVDKILLFSRKQVFCLTSWKLWWAPTTIEFNNFRRNFAKGCSWFFRTCVICQNQKRSVNNFIKDISAIDKKKTNLKIY